MGPVIQKTGCLAKGKSLENELSLTILPIHCIAFPFNLSPPTFSSPPVCLWLLLRGCFLLIFPLLSRLRPRNIICIFFSSLDAVDIQNPAFPRSSLSTKRKFVFSLPHIHGTLRILRILLQMAYLGMILFPSISLFLLEVL